MSEQKILTLHEYSSLFQNIILAEYDNLFSNVELRRDLGLDNETTIYFGMEYLCMATFLLNDLLKVSQYDARTAAQIDGAVRGGVFRRVLNSHATQGIEAQYVLYSLKRGAEFEQIFRRDDEGIKRLIENCLDCIGQEDLASRLPQSLYLMNLLPALIGLMSDLLLCAQRQTGDEVSFRIIPPEEYQ